MQRSRRKVVKGRVAINEIGKSKMSIRSAMVDIGTLKR